MTLVASFTAARSVIRSPFKTTLMDTRNRSDDEPDAQERAGDSRIQVAGSALPPALAASWERSMKHGFRRDDHVLFNTSVSATAAKRAADENRELLQHATAEMIKLYQGLGSARWLALCVDKRGRVVCYVGDRSAAPKALQVLMQPGRVLLESELGTTAPGCALEDMRPAVVARGEHYLTELNHFFCASAPILAPDGELAGALDISGVDVHSMPLAREMMTFAVRRIENQMVAAMVDCALLRFHCDERLVGTPFEGVIAVNPDGIIVGANRTAGQLLLSSNSAVGASLDSVLEGGLDGLRRRARSAADRLISVESEGGGLAVRVVEPSRAAGKRVAVSAPRAAAEYGFIVADPELSTSFDLAVRVVRSGLPIIITGETGTGKEVFARALHKAVRPGGPFLALNCAAIPEGLIEAELFGYADGAYTGGRRGGASGKIEQAHGGALLLDEIGDMSPPLQGRLLRVLQERTVVRIGDSRETPVDLLVICATHRHLEQLITEGRFRQDLYYRLNGRTVQLPPLRERGDIDAVIDGLLHRWSETDESHVAESLTIAARDCLKQYSWPGNVRQMEQVLRSMLALRDSGAVLDLADVPAFIRECRPPERQPAGAANSGRHSLESVQVAAISNALRDHHGNVSLAARALGISRGALYNKMNRLGLRPRTSGPGSGD